MGLKGGKRATQISIGKNEAQMLRGRSGIINWVSDERLCLTSSLGLCERGSMQCSLQSAFLSPSPD